MIFKNMFSFGLTFGAYDWLVKAGSLKTFYVIASIQIGVCLLSIPMCKLVPGLCYDFNTERVLVQTSLVRRTELFSAGTTYLR